MVTVQLLNHLLFELQNHNSAGNFHALNIFKDLLQCCSTSRSTPSIFIKQTALALELTTCFSSAVSGLGYSIAGWQFK